MVSGTAWMLWTCQGLCPVLLPETLSCVALDLLWTWALVCSDCMESLKITRGRVDMTKNVSVYPFFLFPDRLICICCSEQLYALGSSAWIFFQSISACIPGDDDFSSQEWPGRRVQKPSHLDNQSVCICSILLLSFVVDSQNTFFSGLSSVAGEQQCSWSGEDCVELLQWSHWTQKPAASLARRVVFLPARQCRISWFQLKWDSAWCSVSLCLGCSVCSSPQQSRVVFFFPTNLQITLTPQ